MSALVHIISTTAYQHTYVLYFCVLCTDVGFNVCLNGMFKIQSVQLMFWKGGDLGL